MIKCIIFNILIALTVYINTQYIYTGYCCDCKKNNKGSLSNSNKNLGIKINNINPYKNNKQKTETSFPLNTDKTNLSKEGKSNNTDSDKKKLHPILKPQNNDKNDSTKKIKKENEVKKIKDESKKKKEVKTNVKKNEIKNINKVENKEEKENVIKIEINKNSLKISNSKIGEKHFDIEEKDGIVNENFRNTTTLYEINDYIYNMLLKEDIEVKLTGNNLSDKHILFAVVYHISGEGYSYVRIRYGNNATDTVSGLLIYPDNFRFSTVGVSIPVGETWDATEIDAETWSALYDNGCAFLPACSGRTHLSSSSSPFSGLIIDGGYGWLAYYWSSTPYPYNNAVIANPSLSFL